MSSNAAFRMTSQRQVILRELRKVNTHPTADEIYILVRIALPHISLGTVYRNLEILSEMGFVQKLECAGNQRRYDGNPDKHHHIRCLGCGRVSDVEPGVVTHFSFSPEKIPGFQVLDARFLFIGVCESCRTDGNLPAGKGLPGISEL
ncbi:MAG: Fur family transcriptional regulator [Candidatus Latescibacterota bacterium]